MDDIDIVRIECGTDRFAAHTLLARCQAEGVRVELLTTDGEGNSSHLTTQPFSLLVNAEDVDAVRAIATGEPTTRRRQQLDRARRRRTGG